MADLFNKQAEFYAEVRPSYPPELFDFIASKTPRRDLVWDVGTGNGQAAVSLSKIYKEVVGTDTSKKQLDLAARLPNVRYAHTGATINLDDVHRLVAAPSTVDLVTVAQAMHWFDHNAFYACVGSVLRPFDGVIASWCYTNPISGDAAVDAVYARLYAASRPYWAERRRFVDEEFRTIPFPFEPVEGETQTGPFEFSGRKEMDLRAYLSYIRSWSAYQTAKERGVELLPEWTVDEFARAWGDEREVRTVRFPIFLRLGKVGQSDRDKV